MRTEWKIQSVIDVLAISCCCCSYPRALKIIPVVFHGEPETSLIEVICAITTGKKPWFTHAKLLIVWQCHYLGWKRLYVDQLWLREELLVTNFQGKVTFPKRSPQEKNEKMQSLVSRKTRLKISSAYVHGRIWIKALQWYNIHSVNKSNQMKMNIATYR